MKDEIIRARLTSEEKQIISEVAEQEDLSFSDLIRKKLIAEVYDEMENQKSEKINNYETEIYFLKLIIKSLINDKNKLIGLIENSSDEKLKSKIVTKDKTLNKKIKGFRDIDPNIFEKLMDEFI